MEDKRLMNILKKAIGKGWNLTGINAVENFNQCHDERGRFCGTGGEGGGSSGGSSGLSVEQQIEISDIYGKRVTGYNELLTNLEKEFGKDHAVSGRMKTVESIEEKVGRKGVKIADIDDISGTRVLTMNKLDQIETVNNFKARYRHKIKPGSEDDYYSHPKDTGYRAYHATVIENGQPHEVQIRTHKFNEWAEKYHPVYKNEDWTMGAGKDPAVINYFKEAAKAIDAIDSGLKDVKIPRAPYKLDLLGLSL